MTSDTLESDTTMSYEIRDRDIGGILDQSIYLFRDHFKFIAKAIGVLLVPCYLALGLSFVLLTPNAIDVWSGPETMPSDAEFALTVALSLISSVVLGFFVVPLTYGALIYGIASRYLGKTATVKECFAYSLRRLGWMVLGSLLVGIATTVGTFLCIVPGLIVTALFYLYAPVIILERANTFDAFSRSAHLIRGFVWNTIALILVVGIMQVGVSALAGLGPTSVGYQMAAYLAQAISIAFTTVVTVVLYFAARSRVEHLDLELLVNKVDTPPVSGSAL